MRKNRNNKRLICWILALVILIGITLKADERLRILINNYAGSKSKIMANTVINNTVHNYLKDSNLKYNELVLINTDAEGCVTSVEFNTVEITKIKSGLISKVQSEINKRESVVMKIPIGTLTGNQFLNNRGPKIRIEMQVSSAVYSKIASKFISAGINQTLHQITLSISSDIYFVMPWYRSSGSFQTEFTIAETVIVGKVPEAYTNVIEYPGSNIAGEIFDYSASTEG